jgi:hypothetical protein
VTRLQVGASRIKLEPSDFADVVGAALEELGPAMGERQLSIEVPPDLPLVSIDFLLITQVLVNLFSNAIKFSPSDQPIQLRSRIVNDKLEVTVTGRGIGVPKGDLDRVFQNFTGSPSRARPMAWSGTFHLQRICGSASRTNHAGTQSGRWNHRQIRFAGLEVHYIQARRHRDLMPRGANREPDNQSQSGTRLDPAWT